MKMLVICQYYYPEPFRISDICEELVKRGNDVTVITGLPNYPMGEIYDGYGKREKRDEVINGVKIHRCSMIPRKHGLIHRVLNYYSYAYSSERYVKKLGCDFDVVFVNQLSPVIMAKAGIKYKKKHGTKLVLYCLDLWPESLVAGGIKKDSLIYKLFHRLSERIYMQADKLLITSKSFAAYFSKEFGLSDTEYLPQYAESLFIPERCKKEPNGNIDLMFAGNVGAAQSVNTIVEAAKLTSDMPNIHWHIVGDGIELGSLKKSTENSNNITFHGRKPLEEMPECYAMADAMLVTMQKAPVLSLTLPGKVQSYMSAGKPILGAINGEAASIINEAKCGYCCPAEDAEGLADIARSFVVTPDKEIMSHNALAFYQNSFSKERFFDNLESQLRA